MKTTLTLMTLLLSSSLWANELPLAAAKKAIQAAEEYGLKKGWKVSIAVVNSEGNLVLFQRGDGSYSGSVESSISKARSANGFRRSTAAFVQGLKEGRQGLLSVPGVVAMEGGIPLVIGNEHVGAIGVSGAKSTEDEEVALIGAKALTTGKE